MTAGGVGRKRGLSSRPNDPTEHQEKDWPEEGAEQDGPADLDAAAGRRGWRKRLLPGHARGGGVLRLLGGPEI